MTQYFGSCLDSYTSIDIIDCLDMALLNINAKCFLIQYMCIFLFIEFIDFFPFFPNSLPIRLKLLALLPHRFIVYSDSGKIGYKFHSSLMSAKVC